jgi:hypothetical protein
MKQTKYEKVVKGNSGIFKSIWLYGIFSIGFPLVLLLFSEINFLNIVFVAFFDGMYFVLFMDSILEYEKSRKVYWRKIE